MTAATCLVFYWLEKKKGVEGKKERKKKKERKIHKNTLNERVCRHILYILLLNVLSKLLQSEVEEAQ